mgnify:CR=1 FL=1
MVPWRFSFKIRDGKLKLVFPWRFNTPTWRKKNQNLNENQGFFKNFSGFLHFQSRNARVVATLRTAQFPFPGLLAKGTPFDPMGKCPPWFSNGRKEHHSLPTTQGAALRTIGKMTPLVFPLKKWGKNGGANGGLRRQRERERDSSEMRKRESRTFSANQSV